MVAVSPEGFEKGAAIELARRGRWSLNAAVTDRSAGANLGRDLLATPLIDIEAAAGAGYYYDSRRWHPNVGFNLRF